MNRFKSKTRKHRAAAKVYVPVDARDNQYIIAEMPLTDDLIKLVVGDINLDTPKPYLNFYQKLAKLAFDVTEECNIEHANFVANNRLVRVRNSDEQQVLHTAQQSFFFYNPTQNSTFKGYYDGAVRSNKVKFLFLATGDNLRADSGAFHQKVYNAVEIIAQRIGLKAGELKVRDHQHLTYDLFAKEKGDKATITHSFREISARYLQQGVEIDDQHTSVTYAIVNIPMTRRLLKGTDIDYDSSAPFEALYQKIDNAFEAAAKENNLHHIAMVANGMSPIVRYEKDQKTIVNGDIISLGFNPENEDGNVVTHWEGERLEDTIRLIFFAKEDDETHNTYGKFVNQVTQSISLLADELQWKKDKDYMLMRLNQQIIRRV